jgi:hypothetical protein
VCNTSGATFYITGVQLEKGSTATSFDYRPYGTEFMLCQRYYNRVDFSTFVAGFSNSSTSFLCAYTYPVQMRVAPTLITSGTGSDYGLRIPNGTFVTCNAVPSLAGTQVSSTRIDAATASGLTAGAGGLLAASGSSATLSFSSEL